ncbi:calcium-dependent protein kinase 4 isoform X1 [Folsomia candida]|uniref:calcium-dependent protein kinase 4 isoform X1 n=1 Tax=Folsomia candida TaxID=158441 RepID=UPI001604D441|nr:calcium-dependent protein kinase 4 isoform X1 [Folsomia candida]XP_035700933.1 calcium-dependent protein kinase 4 isoform X1 [Folsomia candida]XP_035700934.1 calcium-dependent protein kinase 4 isoform X1 [Folsomia candida]XP_035700935.1 calcium-dependent protein kinase 4 isoform X1 [Folsomia candida]XP_035700936.1 calcium-dependent protein kinase 4 isoform X1 [Folsomia candida]
MARLMDRMVSLMGIRTPDRDPKSTLIYTSCIGHGAYGLVFEATDRTTTSSSAVKFLFPDSEGDAGAENEQRIMRECRITENLAQHENVVRVLKVTEKQFTLADLNQLLPERLCNTKQNKFRAEHAYRLTKVKAIRGISIQMELCGENLRKWLKIQISVPDVNLHLKQFTIIQNIIAGLTHLHDNMIIHRDLKPENIMFTKVGFTLPVKLGDFGQCRNLNRDESQDSTLTSRAGTLDYMAPESFTRRYSFPADIYSLGLVIWEIVQLLKFNEKKNLFDRLVNDKEEWLVKLPPEINGVRGLIIALSKKKVNDRLKTMTQVNEFILDSNFGVNIIAKNDEELRSFLRYAVPRSKATLTAKVYRGNFLIQGQFITIVGQGDTFIVGDEDRANCIAVEGFGHTLKNLKILHPRQHWNTNCLTVTGDGHSFCELTISGRNCILVSGGDHKFEKMKLSNSESGISVIGGSRISINNIQLESIKGYGIHISESSKFNIVSNVTGNNVYCAIICSGSNNRLSKIRLESNTKNEGRAYGVILEKGEFNHVEYLIWSDSLNPLSSNLNIASHKSSAKNCKCGSVCVGGNDVTLENIDGGEEINIHEKSLGSRLVNCRARFLFANDDVTFINSVFGKEVMSSLRH